MCSAAKLFVFLHIKSSNSPSLSERELITIGGSEDRRTYWAEAQVDGDAKIPNVYRIRLCITQDRWERILEILLTYYRA